jgi:hypothetical protein
MLLTFRIRVESVTNKCPFLLLLSYHAISHSVNEHFQNLLSRLNIL